MRGLDCGSFTEQEAIRKAKAAQKKKKKGTSASSEDSEDDTPKPKTKASTASKTAFEINILLTGQSWKKYPDLSVTLLAHIYETAWIKQSLYPPPGPNASTTEGGGTPKTQAHWALALLLLQKDSKYKDALKACKTPKEQLSVGNKIKNRLDVMQKITKRYNDEMGKTGAGLKDASEINTGEKNAFTCTTKWAEISAACPWYFEMRNLMGQRPNLVPTGLGHSNSAVSADVIIPGAAAETEMEMEAGTDADGNNGDGGEGDREEEDIMGNDNDDTSNGKRSIDSKPAVCGELDGYADSPHAGRGERRRTWTAACAPGRLNLRGQSHACAGADHVRCNANTGLAAAPRAVGVGVRAAEEEPIDVPEYSGFGVAMTVPRDVYLVWWATLVAHTGRICTLPARGHWRSGRPAEAGRLGGTVASENEFEGFAVGNTCMMPAPHAFTDYRGFGACCIS
ncbi:hypothetical protein B0H16DRAFT_1472156 [Mycena metata]|uniref:Uncharacterized protein n=1 Tax=Mycena metata TaxID=1033252 RepID=A0AAD7HNM1_9AGAR|nr:hypothetical protein B0H16DRAFT_1472156 [Mycena metata]